MSRAARSYRPNAEPKSKSKSRAPASRHDGRVPTELHVALADSYKRRREFVATAFGTSGRSRKEVCWRRDLRKSLSGMAHRRASNRDSSHERVVSSIKFQRSYRVAAQCVASASDGASLERERWCLHYRGPDNGKPVEKPGRKAPRLQRRKPRHASRAPERFSWRST